MNIAVISDIHGNSSALKYVLDDIRSKGINKLIVLGDIVMKGSKPQEAFELIKESEFEVLAWIKGNTDEWFEVMSEEDENFKYLKYAKDNMKKESIEFLSKLKDRISLNINGTKILCVHGTPRLNVAAIDNTVSEEEMREELKGVKEDVVLCGHSHTTFIGRVEEKRIFNVGSVGDSLDDDKKISYGILNFKHRNLELINIRI